MQAPITHGYFIAVVLFLACCWLNPNDAIPHQIHSRTRKQDEQVSHRFGHRSAKDAASLSHDANRKPILMGRGNNWRFTQRPRDSRGKMRNINVNVNKNVMTYLPVTEKNLAQSEDTVSEFPWSFTKPLKRQAMNCTEPHNSNDRYSSSFDVDSTVGPINVDEDFKFIAEAETKKTSSVHVGEDITLCWIETTTIKEDHSMHPVQRQVLREYTISFENSATIPERYLECIQVEGESDSTNSNFPKSTLFEVIDENTRHSRVVNFTTVSHTEDLTVWQHKRVRCGVGPVVTKNIIEWTDEHAKNPKKRIEIKVSPKVHRLTAVPTETEPCTTDLLDWQVTPTTNSALIEDCGPGSTCKSGSDCVDGSCIDSSTSQIDVTNNLQEKETTVGHKTPSDSSEIESSITRSTEASTAMSSTTFNPDCGPGSTCESSSDCVNGNCGDSSTSQIDVTNNLKEKETTVGHKTPSDSSEIESSITRSTEASTAMSSTTFNPDCGPGSTCESSSDCVNGNCGDSSTSQIDVTNNLQEKKTTVGHKTPSDSSETESLITRSTEASTAISSTTFDQDCGPESTCESSSDCVDGNCGDSSTSQIDVTNNLQEEETTVGHKTPSDSSETESLITRSTEASTAMSSTTFNLDCGPGSTCESSSDCVYGNCSDSSTSQTDVTNNLWENETTVGHKTPSDSSEMESSITRSTEASTAMSSTTFNQDCGPGSTCESSSDCVDGNCGDSSTSQIDVTNNLQEKKTTVGHKTPSDSSETESLITRSTEASTAISSTTFDQDCGPGSTCESSSDCVDGNCGDSSTSQIDVTNNLQEEETTAGHKTPSDSSETESLITRSTEASTAMSSTTFDQDCGPGSTCESSSDCVDGNCGDSSTSQIDVTNNLQEKETTVGHKTPSDSSETESLITRSTEASTAMSSTTFNQDCGPGSTCESSSDCVYGNCSDSSTSQTDVTNNLWENETTVGHKTPSDSSEMESSITRSTEASTAMSSTTFNQDCGPGSTCESSSDCVDGNCGDSSTSQTDVTNNLQEKKTTVGHKTPSDSSETESLITRSTEASTAISSTTFDQDCGPGSTCESSSDCVDGNCGDSSTSQIDVTNNLQEKETTVGHKTPSDSSETESLITRSTEASTAMSSTTFNQDCGPGSTCESSSDCVYGNCSDSSTSQTDVTNNLWENETTVGHKTPSDSSEMESSITRSTEASTAMSSTTFNQDCGPGSTCESSSDCVDGNCGDSSTSQIDVTNNLQEKKTTVGHKTPSDSSETESLITRSTEASTAISSTTFDQDCGPGSTCESSSDCVDGNCGDSSTSQIDVTNNLQEKETTVGHKTPSDSSETESLITRSTEASTAMSSTTFNQDCGPGSTCESSSDCVYGNCSDSSTSQTDVTNNLWENETTVGHKTPSDSSEMESSITRSTEASTAMSSTTFNQDCGPGSTCESSSDCVDGNCGDSSTSQIDVTNNLWENKTTVGHKTPSDSSEIESSITRSTEASTAMSSTTFNQDCGPGATCESSSDCVDGNCGDSSTSQIDVTNNLQERETTVGHKTPSDSSETESLITLSTEASTAMSSTTFDQDCGPGSTCESSSDCVDGNCGDSLTSQIDVTNNLWENETTVGHKTPSDSSEIESSITRSTEASTAMSSTTFHQDCGPGSTCESSSDCVDGNCSDSSTSQIDVTNNLQEEETTVGHKTPSDSSETESLITRSTEASTAMSSTTFNQDCGPGSTCESSSDCVYGNCSDSSTSQIDVTNNLQEKETTVGHKTPSDSLEVESLITRSTEASTAMSSTTFNQDCGPGSTCESSSDCVDGNCGDSSTSQKDVTNNLWENETTVGHKTPSDSSEMESLITRSTEASTAMSSTTFDQDCGPGSTCESSSNCVDGNCGDSSTSQIDVTNNLQEEETTVAHKTPSESSEMDSLMTESTEASTAMTSTTYNQDCGPGSTCESSSDCVYGNCSDSSTSQTDVTNNLQEEETTVGHKTPLDSLEVESSITRSTEASTAMSSTTFNQDCGPGSTCESSSDCVDGNCGDSSTSQIDVTNNLQEKETTVGHKTPSDSLEIESSITRSTEASTAMSSTTFDQDCGPGSTCESSSNCVDGNCGDSSTSQIDVTNNLQEEETTVGHKTPLDSSEIESVITPSTEASTAMSSTTFNQDCGPGSTCESSSDCVDGNCGDSSTSQIDVTNNLQEKETTVGHKTPSDSSEIESSITRSTEASTAMSSTTFNQDCGPGSTCESSSDCVYGNCSDSSTSQTDVTNNLWENETTVGHKTLSDSSEMESLITRSTEASTAMSSTTFDQDCGPGSTCESSSNCVDGNCGDSSTSQIDVTNNLQEEETTVGHKTPLDSSEIESVITPSTEASTAMSSTTFNQDCGPGSTCESSSDCVDGNCGDSSTSQIDVTNNLQEEETTVGHKTPLDSSEIESVITPSTEAPTAMSSTTFDQDCGPGSTCESSSHCVDGNCGDSSTSQIDVTNNLQEEETTVGHKTPSDSSEVESLITRSTDASTAMSSTTFNQDCGPGSTCESSSDCVDGNCGDSSTSQIDVTNNLQEEETTVGHKTPSDSSEVESLITRSTEASTAMTSTTYNQDCGPGSTCESSSHCVDGNCGDSSTSQIDVTNNLQEEETTVGHKTPLDSSEIESVITPSTEAPTAMSSTTFDQDCGPGSTCESSSHCVDGNCGDSSTSQIDVTNNLQEEETTVGHKTPSDSSEVESLITRSTDASTAMSSTTFNQDCGPGSTCESSSDCVDGNCGDSSTSQIDVTNNLQEEETTVGHKTPSDSSEVESLITRSTDASTAMSSTTFNQDCGPGSTCESSSDCVDGNCGDSSTSQLDVTNNLQEEETTVGHKTPSDSSEVESLITRSTDASTAMSSTTFNQDCGPGSTCESSSHCVDGNCGDSSTSQTDVTYNLQEEETTVVYKTPLDSSEVESLITRSTEASTAMSSTTFNQDCGPGSTCESSSDCVNGNCGDSSTSQIDVTNNLQENETTVGHKTPSDSSEIESSITRSTEASTAMSSTTLNQDCGPGSTCESSSDCVDGNCGDSSTSQLDVTNNLQEEETTVGHKTPLDSLEIESVITPSTEASTAMSSTTFDQDCGPGSTCESSSDCVDGNCGDSSTSQTDVTYNLQEEETTVGHKTPLDSSEVESSITRSTEASTAMSSTTFNQDCGPGSTCESSSNCVDGNCGDSSTPQIAVTNNLWEEETSVADITSSDNLELETLITTSIEALTAMTSTTYNQDCGPGSTCDSSSDCVDGNCGDSSTSQIDVTNNLQEKVTTVAHKTPVDSSEMDSLMTESTEASTAMTSTTYNQDCGPGSTCESSSDCVDGNCGDSSTSQIDVTNNLWEEETTAADITSSDNLESETSITTSIEALTATSSTTYNQVTDDLREDQTTGADTTLSDSLKSETAISTSTEASIAMSSTVFNQDCGPGSTCESSSDCVDGNCGDSSTLQIDVTNNLWEEETTAAHKTPSDSSEMDSSITPSTEASTAMSSTTFDQDCGPGSTCESSSDCVDGNCGDSSTSQTDVTNNLWEEETTAAHITPSDSSEMDSLMTLSTEASTAMTSTTFNQDCGPGSTCESSSDCVDGNCGDSWTLHIDVTNNLWEEETTEADTLSSDNLELGTSITTSIEALTATSSTTYNQVTDDFREDQTTAADTTPSNSLESETAITTPTEASIAMSSTIFNHDCGPGSTCDSSSDCVDGNCGDSSTFQMDFTDDLSEEETTAADTTPSDSSKTENLLTTSFEASTEISLTMNNQDCGPGSTCESSSDCFDENCGNSSTPRMDVTDNLWEEETNLADTTPSDNLKSETSTTPFTEALTVLSSITYNESETVNYISPLVSEGTTLTTDLLINLPKMTTTSRSCTHKTRKPKHHHHHRKCHHKSTTSMVSDVKSPQATENVLILSVTMDSDSEHDIETGDQAVDDLPIRDDMYYSSDYLDDTSYSNVPSEETVPCERGGSCTPPISPEQTIVSWEDDTSIETETPTDSKKTDIEQLSLSLTTDTGLSGSGSTVSLTESTRIPITIEEATNSAITAVNSTLSSINDVSGAYQKQKQKLGLRIKILLEHTDDNDEKQTIVEINKNLLIGTQADEQGDQTLIDRVKELNNSIDIQTIEGLFNCPTVKKLAADLSHITAKYPVMHGETTNIDVNNARASHGREKRHVSSLYKQDMDLEMSLPGILADIHAGLDYVMSQIPSEHAVNKRSAKMFENKIPRFRILDLISNPQDDRIHARVKRNIGIQDVVINEKDMPKDVQEVGHWSNERVLRGLNSGHVRTLTDFTIYKGP